MPDRRPTRTPEQTLAALQRDRRRVARERMVRSVAGDRWRRMTRLIPVLFRREGELCVHALRAPREEVVAALCDDGVFALDTALRLTRGRGFMTGGDLHVYVRERGAIERLARRGLIEPRSCADTSLVRPWPGPPRLFVCVVEEWPEHRVLPSGERVVTDARLRAELVGAVGLRPDLFALAE